MKKLEVRKMGKKVLHPSVEQFKDFVKKNPKIIQEVRKEKFTWQELYEDWYLLGEEDPRWEEFRKEDKNIPEEEEAKTDLIGQIIGAVKRMDVNQLEGHIYNLSKALDAVQGVISQFQGANPKKSLPKNERPPHPFMFRKD
jgi:hypothetical protein